MRIEIEDKRLSIRGCIICERPIAFETAVVWISDAGDKVLGAICPLCVDEGAVAVAPRARAVAERAQAYTTALAAMAEQLANGEIAFPSLKAVYAFIRAAADRKKHERDEREVARTE